MEIISYVLSGELAHRDSLGNGSTIHPGDAQRMSAVSGVQHSEFNPSASKPVHFPRSLAAPIAGAQNPDFVARVALSNHPLTVWILTIRRTKPIHSERHSK